MIQHYYSQLLTLNHSRAMNSFNGLASNSIVRDLLLICVFVIANNCTWVSCNCNCIHHLSFHLIQNIEIILQFMYFISRGLFTRWNLNIVIYMFYTVQFKFICIPWLGEDLIAFAITKDLNYASFTLSISHAVVHSRWINGPKQMAHRIIAI